MDEIEPRITGIETEYGLTYQVSKRVDNNGFDITGAIDLENLLLDNLPEGTVSGSRGLLTNGDRLYVDMGEHPEHSTAEAASFREVVAHELAGERIVYSPFENLVNRETLESFDLNKRVVDMNDTFWGRHENYLTPRSINVRKFIVPAIALHLATRPIWSGAGMVRPDGSYSLAQKMNAVRTLTSGTASSTRRPLVDVARDEPLADGEKWRRLHVASVDANMIPWATWMALGTTSIVLRMIESGDMLDNLQLNNPVQAAHRIIRDVGLDDKQQLLNSKKTKSALDIQEALAERAGKMAQKNKLPEEEAEIAENWQRICADLRSDPEACFDRVEWVAKRYVLGRIATKNDVRWDSLVMRSMDIRWDNLDPSRGFAQRLRQKNKLATVVDEQDINDALTHPPHSRAQLRSNIVHALWNSEAGLRTRNRDVDWHKASYVASGAEVCTVDILDPYQTESEAVEEFINKVA